MPHHVIVFQIPTRGDRIMNALRSYLPVLLVAILVAISLGVAVPTRAEDGSPAASAFMRSLGAKAVTELTDATLLQPAREARFRRFLNDHFDMPGMSKFVLGRYWRMATPQERAEFQQLFEDFIVHSYSARLVDYRGAIIVSGSSKDASSSFIVHSKIDTPASEDIRVDWRVRSNGDSFVIVDIIVEGVSMAVTQRSQFASVIQSRGGKVANLLEALRIKNSQTADGSGTY